MSTLYDIVPKDILVSTTFDEHKFVKKFTDANENDSNFKQTLINAYMVRDVHYNGKKTLKQLMEEHCSKLGLHLTDTSKKNRREYKFMKDIKEMVNKQEFVENTIEEYYNSVINQPASETELANEEKYVKIMNMIDNGADYEDVYNEFSVQDLQYIGW